MQLTKTDFIQYLNCPKSLWLYKHDPNAYPKGDFSVFLEKLIREGYEVERYVKQFFENENAREVDFQAVFESDDGLYARADAFERTADGKVILYEIKSSTRVKTDTKHNHIKDACFQKICAERAGQQIDRVYIVHLNGSYIRKGDIDPAELLTFEDVTERVENVSSETKLEINSALELLRLLEIDKNGCTCLNKSRSNHCDSFSLFNPDIPKPSIYSLPRLSKKKRADFVDSGIFDLHGVPDSYSLSTPQKIVVQAAKAGAPQINRGEIGHFISNLQFPLYFLDFETYASAIPLIDGTNPHGAFPVQYSLHTLDGNGTLTHKEFLEREPRLPRRLIKRMYLDIGSQGSVVSWHASFEKKQNRTMADMFPGKADFLDDLNSRMVDLEDLFKTAYVDVRFDGSSSIKKVLPVVCPHLNYEGLDIQDGGSAMEKWERMTKAEPAEAEQIAKSLLNYCELDTFAMVEIYRFLVKLRR
jgi:CRISPR/Cas system-associated exonuclease Cas4 (RecB family)